jgi:hypothetical protein
MSHLTHPIKVEAIEIHQAPDKPTTIHAVGCSHGRRAHTEVRARKFIPTEDDGYEDDWYAVAPCARKAS